MALYVTPHVLGVLQTSDTIEEESKQDSKKEVSFGLSDGHKPEDSDRVLHGQWSKAIPELVEKVHTARVLCWVLLV